MVVPPALLDMNIANLLSVPIENTSSGWPPSRLAQMYCRVPSRPTRSQKRMRHCRAPMSKSAESAQPSQSPLPSIVTHEGPTGGLLVLICALP